MALDHDDGGLVVSFDASLDGQECALSGRVWNAHYQKTCSEIVS